MSKRSHQEKRRLEPAAGAARGICVAIIVACLACATQAGAISFSGTTSGIFVNPTGSPGMVTKGTGTNHFQWGVGYQSPPSSLKFNGLEFAGVAPDQFFSLGTLSYFNGTLLAGTEAYSADLRAILGFTSPMGLTKSLDFDFQLLNTPNTGSAAQNADSVFLTSLFPTTIFTLDGIDYTLRMGFGSVIGKGSGYSQIDKFSVLEGAGSSATLVGVITANNAPPSLVPDTGSTLALMAVAIVVLGGLRKFVTAKA